MIADTIRRWAHRRPEKIALIQDGVALSYAAFARAIAASRGYFARRELPVGSTAIVLAENLRDAWFIVLGVRTLGLDTICVQSAAQIEKLQLRNVGCVVASEAAFRNPDQRISPDLRVVTIPAATF